LLTSPDLLFNLILNQGRKNPDAPAVLTPDDKVIPYRVLSDHLQATTLQLTRMGIRPGDRLAVVLPNGPEMATAFLAISSVCTCAPLNPSFPAGEYRFSLEELQVKALVAISGNNHPACQAAFELGIPILHLRPDSRLAGVFTLSGGLPFDNTLTRPTLAGLDDAALVLQTSGTTSRPKIVPLTNRNIFYSVNNIVETYALTPADRCLNMMPLFHIHGLMGALSASLVAGASIVCTPGYLPEQVLGWLSALKPTWYTAVPTMHQSILEQVRLQPDFARQVHLRFIRSCSSSLPPQVAQELETVFETPVLEAYGMTEATHQMASNPLPPHPRKFGSVGQATGSTHISIRDETGKALPSKAIGEICIRGENVMSGYENNPEANAASFIDGWLRTGDRGFLDEEDYLFIQGRIKELINRGGEKISPREIEELLLQHPAVQQAAVFAVPHSSLGEDVAAAIVLKDTQTVSLQELRQFAATRLADYKVPRQIIFLKEIPKGPTGKVQRIGLAEKLEHELDALNPRKPAATSESPTLVEQEILSIWREVLGMEGIGVQDDFLSLGGDSIQAARILTRVNAHFGKDLQLIDIFNASTVALMAEIVQAGNVQDVGHG
jgi:acyl-CoA synthetase (AMP-forming)/AMP-acid ligase II/acyl carrier protein